MLQQSLQMTKGICVPLLFNHKCWGTAFQAKPQGHNSANAIGGNCIQLSIYFQLCYKTLKQMICLSLKMLFY